MKMFFEIILLLAVIIILICLFFYFTLTPKASIPQQGQLSSVCFKENCFSVELAKTESQRETGLMYRKELDENKGMLFIFDKEGIYPFWMKNTLIPLDIIWIDSYGKVVFISRNVQSCKNLICPTFVSSRKAKYVLEINAGICQEIGLKVGDQLKIPR